MVDENSCDPRAVYLHRALRTELLTAETANAEFAVDDRFPVLDADRLRRADLPALVTADALGRLQLRSGGQCLRRDAAENIFDYVVRRAGKSETMANGDRLVIRNVKRQRITENIEFFPCRGDQPAAIGGVEGRHLVLPEPDQRGGEKVKFMRGGRCEDRTDRARRAGGRSVPFHADDRIADREARLEIFVQIDDHVGKLRIGRKAEMILRLDRPGNGAEKVLRRAGISHHAVRLELADVDDDICLVKIGGVGEAARFFPFLEIGVADRKVIVQLRAGFHTFRKSRRVINPIDKCGVVKSAGRVADDDAGAAGAEHLGQSGQNLGMRRHCLVRGGDADEVRLQNNSHALGYKINAADGGNRRFYRGSDGVFFIRPARDDRYFAHEAPFCDQRILRILRGKIRESE